jgi:penicillin amidase
MKALKHGLTILAAVAALAGIAGWVFFRLPLPDYEGTVEIEGLASDVRVHFDRYGIPHILAENDEDLFLAQGYLTARERMFQMDMTRLAGRGELSSLFGESTVPTDRFMKTVGFYRLARAEYRRLSPECVDAILAYTRGVNAYLETMRHLPREYVFLRARPAPWVPEDTVVCGTLMAYGLTRSKKADLILHQIGEKTDPGTLGHFVPVPPDSAPTVSGPAARQGSGPRTLPFVWNSSSFLAASVIQTPPGLPETAASNWMIFAGSVTSTGAPLFTGSPDLEPKIPALFYVVHLKSDRTNVMGGAIPGTPGVSAVGFNGEIAWAAVNGRVDELDYFIERVDPGNPDRYLTENGYEDFQVVEETLRTKTRDGIRQEPLRVRLSRHGPIISEVMPLAPENAAMQWVGLQPTGLFEAFLALNRATDFASFRSALSHMKTPTLNVGYADAKGNIGYQYTASPPIRKKGSGALPVPGWTGEYEWEGAIPFERLPYDLNPEKGYLGSFNNPARETDFHMTNHYLYERAFRFEELAAELGGLSPEGARALQRDTVSVVAKRWVPHAVRACSERSDLAPALRLFEGWDFGIRKESPAAALFNAFYFRLMENAFADEVGLPLWKEHLSESYHIYIPDLLLLRMADRNDHILFDNVLTPAVRETRDMLVTKSVEDAVGELTRRLGPDPGGWAWGKVHRMTFEHPLGAKLPFLNLRPIPTDGDGFTINAGWWNSRKPYEMESGGVIRLVVDFSDIENSTIICPPGQSGHWTSPHYDDLASLWAEGGQIPMHFAGAEDLPRVLTLRAAGKKP